MNGAQQIVGLAGVGLIAANFWTQQRHTVLSGITSGNKLGSANDQTKAAHDQLKIIGIELLAVGIATLLAGVNSTAGSALALVAVALWILWLMRYLSTKGQ